MKLSESKMVEWFLRIALSAGFLSAVADRFGLWSKDVSAWGNWENFIKYTQTLTPYIPAAIIPLLGYIATALEILFGVLLLTNFKTNLVSKASGVLLLLFALSMTFSNSIKVPLDYSVFTASASAFALSLIISQRSYDKAVQPNK
jgi:thiosulfate dehydrogenase (quinone) large subunit